MWHLIEENTMTVGVPFSRQFRKIITSDLYGIGDLSDRKFSHQEIATMQTGTVVSFHERGSELRRGTFLVSSVSVLRRISPGQLIGELLSNQELTHFCQIKNLSTKTYATSVIEAYEFVKKVGENTRIMQKISMNKNIVPANKRALPREPVQVINVDPDPQMKKQKSAEESFTRDFPKGKSSTENKEENYIDDDDDKPVIDSFHVSNSNKVHTVEDSDDDMGDVKVELIEEDDEEIEEIRSEPPPPIAVPHKLNTEAQANTALQIQRLLEYQKQMQTLKLSPQIRRTGEVVNSGVRKYNSPGTIRDISFNQGNPSKYGRITVMGLVFRIEVEGKVYNYKLKTLSYCKAGIVAYLGCVNQSRGKRPLSCEGACKATARLVLDSSLPELVDAHQRKSLSYSEPILRKISTYRSAETSYQSHVSEACEWNGISYTAHPENFAQANLTPVQIAPAHKVAINKI